MQLDELEQKFPLFSCAYEENGHVSIDERLLETQQEALDTAKTVIAYFAKDNFHVELVVKVVPVLRVEKDGQGNLKITDLTEEKSSIDDG